MPEIGPHLQPEEFIFYVVHGKSLIGGKRYWVVTDRKLVIYRGGHLLELPWSEVVSVGQPLLILSNHWIIIQTFKEKVKVCLEHWSIHGSWTFYRNVMAALNDYNTQRKNIKAIICSLKL
jgi:hypothetical protein